MKLLSACLAVAALLLLAAFLYENQKTSALEASLVALGRDRDAMQKELRRLNGEIAALPTRVAAAATARPEPAREVTHAPAPAVETVEPLVPVELPGVTIQAPPGWKRNGAKAESYVVGVDATEPWGGMPSAYVQSLTPTVEGGFGGMMQTTSAENYVGKRVRLSGWIKTENVTEGGQLWLRVDGQERGHTLQFDNMDNRAVKGTSDWREASIVLDVPPGASALAYGFFVKSGGKMWVNGQRIEEVGADVPSTNMIQKPPGVPRNLGFDPAQPK
jgi:hypothetical protein